MIIVEWEKLLILPAIVNTARQAITAVVVLIAITFAISTSSMSATVVATKTKTFFAAVVTFFKCLFQDSRTPSFHICPFSPLSERVSHGMLGLIDSLSTTLPQSVFKAWNPTSFAHGSSSQRPRQFFSPHTNPNLMNRGACYITIKDSLPVAYQPILSIHLILNFVNSLIS